MTCRSDAWRNLRQIARAPACWAWVGTILGIQAIVSLAGGPGRQPAQAWFRLLGLGREGIAEGKIWQLNTYALLHGGWLHAAINALFLLAVGSRIEHVAGRAVLCGTVLSGILGGGLCHVLLAPGGGEISPLLVGMSGGCVALLLLLTTLSPGSRMLPLPVSGRSLGAGILIAEAGLALIDPALGLPVLAELGNDLVRHGMGSWFQLGHACHLGGGLAGWLIGRRLLRPRVTLESLRRAREGRER